MKLHVLLGTISFIGLSLSNAIAVGQPDDARIERVITQAIQPAFAALHEGSLKMNEAMQAACAAPSPSNLAAAQNAFSQLVVNWGRVELIRMGPLTQDNQLERMLFWPDRKSIGLKQVQKIINTNDETALNVKTLKDKSVAVQGLLALEFVLYGTGYEALNTADGALRCQYGSAITANIQNISAILDQEWRANEPTSIGYLWQNPSASNPLFRDDKEQLSRLIKLIGDGFEIITAQRLTPFLQDDFSNAKPKLALFWRSGNSLKSIEGNLQGLEALVKAANFEASLTGSDTRLADGLFFEFANAQKALAKLPSATSEIANDKSAYDQLTYVRIVVSSLTEIIRDQISPLFGLSSGFSSLDGD